MANRRGVETVEKLFFPEHSSDVNLQKIVSDLDLLFATSVMGFRELLATIVYGRFLDAGYSPRHDLYKSNPRSLYENGIKPVFDSRRIPCGQSGPLNIAKATKSLNEDWASAKRPRKVAEALVRVSDWIELQDEGNLRAVGCEIGKRFDALAQSALDSQIVLNLDSSALALSKACMELIQSHPNKGEVPQVICGLILESQFHNSKEFKVFGTLDSTSATNLTSKKLGDLTIESSSGAAVSIYEVTVKRFGEQRIREAVQSVKGFFAPDTIPSNFEILVLCRTEDLPEGMEISKSGHLLGELHVSGITFEFVDIFSWIASKFAEFDIEKRMKFFIEIQDYLNRVRTPVEVRNAWKNYFEL